jgi:hypothetical protein
MSPPLYRLVIKGGLGPRYACAFDGMTLHAHDGETDITGPVIDESHLHGLIQRIASLGLTLHSLTHSKPRTPRLTRNRIDNQPGSSTTTPALPPNGP